jgi:signal transduction histidine kinase
LAVDAPERLDAGIEAAAYFVVSEALTNVAKYAQAETASVQVRSSGGSLYVTVADDGIGGAELEQGSGFRGLADRVEAVGGVLDVTSPPGRARG